MKTKIHPCWLAAIDDAKVTMEQGTEKSSKCVEIDNPERSNIQQLWHGAVNVDLPPEISPGLEAVELYLEAAQADILQLAQDLEAQEAGFA